MDRSMLHLYTLPSSLPRDSSPASLSATEMLQTYFLTEKLYAYGRLLRLPLNDIGNTLVNLSTLAQQTGATPDLLSDVKAYAHRLANSTNPLDIDDGTRALDKADEAKTPGRKAGSVGAWHYAEDLVEEI
jgi:hypothetical protein